MIRCGGRCNCTVRICYLADAGSIHTQKWVKCFADKGHKVDLISLTSLGRDLPNVTLHRLKMLQGIRLAPLMALMIQVRRLVNRIEPDILHAHYALPYGFWGALTMFHPLVLTVWGSDVLISPNSSRLLMCKLRFALARADCITCDGDQVMNKMIRLGVQRGKLRLIYFGVDTKKFNPSKRDPNFKQKMHLRHDSVVVISLRSLNPLYDVESLIRAAPTVLRDVPQAKFVIAGDGEQKGFLEDLSKSLDLADSVQFIGFIPHDELPRYLASADIYVSTSLSDSGLATSTAEAMASQLPVVITDVADNKNWVKDGEGGFIVPPKNPTLLAERIVYLLENEATRRQFGAVNRKIIRDRSEYSEQMRAMEHIYEELETH